MLICHCNVITETELVGVIREFLREDPWQIIVPAKVYRELGKRGRCCGCFPNVVDLITKVVDAYHSELAVAAAPVIPHRDALPLQRDVGELHARRTRSHRAAQRSAVSRTGSGQPVLGALPSAQ